MKRKRIIISCLLAVLAGLFLAGPASIFFLNSQKVLALTFSGEWVDKDNINIRDDGGACGTGSGGGTNCTNGSPDRYTDKNGNRTFVRQGDNSVCQAYIRDFSPDNKSATLYSGQGVPPNCGNGSPQGQVVFSDKSLANANSESKDKKKECEENSDSDLRWIFCPILRALDKAIQGIDELINDILFIKPEVYSSGGLQGTWAKLRDLAYIVLIPIVLVTVISTALGFSLVDAYTVKKVLPRLVTAVIFMALSWEIVKFIVVFTNILGQGVGGLLASSFGGAKDLTLAKLFHSPSGGGVFVGMLAAGVVASFVSIGIVLSYAFITILALVFGYILLAGRQFVIVALMLFAPIAILAWIFPGNAKLWKAWWGSFSKLLLLYPMIMILIIGGRVFAAVIWDSENNTGGGQNGKGAWGIAGTILKLIAYIGPYFLIPATFKFAGSAFASLSGIANDKSRGLFDRQKQYRGKKIGENLAKTKGFSRFSERNALSRGFNRLAGGIASGPRGWAPTGAAQARRSTNKLNYAAQARETNPNMKPWLNDDGVMKALSFDTAEQAQNEWVNEAGLTDVARGRRQNSVNIASQIGFNKGNSTTAFNRLGEMGFGFDNHDQLVATANRLSNGDQAMQRSLIDSFEYNSKAAGRYDLSRGGEDQNAPEHEQMWARWNNGSLYQHATAKEPNMQGFADFFSHELQIRDDPSDSIEERDEKLLRRSRAAEFFSELSSIKPNAGGGVKEVINNTLSDGLNQQNLNDTYDAIATRVMTSPDGSVSDGRGGSITHDDLIVHQTNVQVTTPVRPPFTGTPGPGGAPGTPGAHGTPGPGGAPGTPGVASGMTETVIVPRFGLATPGESRAAVRSAIASRGRQYERPNPNNMP